MSKPTHFLNIVTGDGDTARFTTIAALWPTRSGGYSGEIPAGVTITGRVVITEAKAKADTGGAQ